MDSIRVERTLPEERSRLAFLLLPDASRFRYTLNTAARALARVSGPFRFVPLAGDLHDEIPDLLVPNQASESNKRFIWRRLRDKKRYFPPLSCT